MQDNQEILENSQTKLRQDALNNSFSDLEEQFNQDIELQQQIINIDVADEPSNSCETLIRQQLQEIIPEHCQSEAAPICGKPLSRNNLEMNHLSSSVFIKDQEQIYKTNLKTEGKQHQKIQEEHIQKIKMIYSQSFLGSEKITLSQIKKLKVFLFIPKYGEELVRWGNQKFGTQHTVVSALERLEHLEESECSEFTVKLKQNIKYFLLLCLCLIIIKVFL